MIVNKPIAEMSKFEFDDMMITLKAQYHELLRQVCFVPCTHLLIDDC